MKQLVLAAAVITLSCIVTLLSTVAIALLLDHTGHAMSWFSNTFLLFGLYVAPACCVILSTCVMAKKYLYEVLLMLLHLYIYCVSILWTDITSLCSDPRIVNNTGMHLNLNSMVRAS